MPWYNQMAPRARRNRNARKGKKRTTWRPKRRTSRTYSPVFTEMLQAGDLQINAGSQFVCKMSDVPQYANYSVLYKQFCIKKLQVMILPRLNEFGSGTGTTTGTSYWVPRLAYCIDSTPSTANPPNELSVLENNGAKVVMMNKKISITCYPKPSLGMQDMVNGGNVATRFKGPVWLNTDSTDVAYNGLNINHGAIRYWITANPLYSDYQFDVYYKITF